jgi:hypothetical protein
LARLRVVSPIVAVPILSVVGSLLLMVLTSAGASSVGATGVLIPGAIYDGVLALVLGPLIISAHDRRQPVERLDW